MVSEWENEHFTSSWQNNIKKLLESSIIIFASFDNKALKKFMHLRNLPVLAYIEFLDKLRK